MASFGHARRYPGFVGAGTEQTIRFAAAGDRTIAWAAVGNGPPLVIGGWWMSHLELDWAIPAFRGFVMRLAEHHTVVRYDRPGCGLSDRVGPPDLTLDGEVDVLARLVHAAAPGAVTLFGASSGGPVAAAFAARHPGRVQHLVLYGTYPDGSGIADSAARAELVNLVGAHWGLGSRVLADLFMPSATAPERAEFAHFQRASAPADVAARSLESVYTFDVRTELARVAAPTLVLHRRDDHAIPVALGREVAAAIPDATFADLDGHDHFPWRGDTDAIVNTVLEFLGVPEVDTPIDLAVLTNREREVLRLVAHGLADREIARRLSLSPHTVHRHLGNIHTKLGLASRAAAAAQATRAGLI